jgi:hypothetical protein
MPHIAILGFTPLCQPSLYGPFTEPGESGGRGDGFPFPDVVKEPVSGFVEFASPAEHSARA